MRLTFSDIHLTKIMFRSNYAWDMGALNSNMMSYSNYGTHNTDYEVSNYRAN